MVFEGENFSQPKIESFENFLYLLRMVIGRLRKWLTVVRSFKTGLGRLGHSLPPKIAKIHVCPKLGGKFGVLDSWLRRENFQTREI